MAAWSCRMWTRLRVSRPVKTRMVQGLKSRWMNLSFTDIQTLNSLNIPNYELQKEQQGHQTHAVLYRAENNQYNLRQTAADVDIFAKIWPPPNTNLKITKTVREWKWKNKLGICAAVLKIRNLKWKCLIQKPNGKFIQNTQSIRAALVNK